MTNASAGSRSGSPTRGDRCDNFQRSDGTRPEAGIVPSSEARQCSHSVLTPCGGDFRKAFAACVLNAGYGRKVGDPGARTLNLIDLANTAINPQEASDRSTARSGATHFQMKTLKNVSAEMALHVLAYNIKRMISILGVGGLMDAIRV